MSYKNGKIISLSKVRALRDTFVALHSPESQAIIYSGALSEFKKLISPVIRELLCAKGAPEHFQKELIELLEKVYAGHHVNETPQVIPK